jgi:hypothetical protein
VFRASHAADGRPLEGLVNGVHKMQFMDMNRRLVAVTENSAGLRPAWEAIVWNVETGRREASLFLGEDVTAVSFVPGTSMVVLGRVSGEQQVVDLSATRTRVAPQVSISQEPTGWRSAISSW